MNGLKKPVKTGIFALFLGVSVGSHPTQAEEFVSEKFGFSILHDSDFILSEVKLYNVALALKGKNNNFPTFNVVVESGIADLNAPKAVKEKAMLDSYMMVGIKDVSILSSSEDFINGQQVFKTQLEYSLNDLKMTSYVALFSGSDRRFILTFIDTKDGFKTSQNRADAIFSSFKMRTPSTGSNDTKSSSWGKYFKARSLVPAFIILVVIVITVNFLHSRDND